VRNSDWQGWKAPAQAATTSPSLQARLAAQQQKSLAARAPQAPTVAGFQISMDLSFSSIKCFSIDWGRIFFAVDLISLCPRSFSPSLRLLPRFSLFSVRYLPVVLGES